MAEPRMALAAAIDVLARRRDRQVVLPTMSAIGPWRRRSPHDRNLPAQSFMGGGSTLGLGIALARPDVPVWIIDGDASLAMQLGSLLTIANARPRRFLHVVIHNDENESSGGQPLVGAGRASFAELARAAGYADARTYRDAATFDAEVDALLATDGPVLVEWMTLPRRLTPEPRPSLARRAVARARAVARRLQRRLRGQRDLSGQLIGFRPAALHISVNWPRVRDSLAKDR